MPGQVNTGRIGYQQGKGEAFIIPEQNLTGLQRLTDAAERGNLRLDKKKADDAKKENKDRVLAKLKVDAPYSRDKPVVMEAIKSYESYIIKNSDNPDLYTPGTKTYMQNENNAQNARNLAEISKRHHDYFTKEMTALNNAKPEDYINKKSYGDAMETWYVGDDGTRTSASDNIGVAPNRSDPQHFAKGRFLENFMQKQVPMVKSRGLRAPDGDGGYIEGEEIESKYYKIRNGDIVFDENGAPIVEVTDAQAMTALQNTKMQDYANYMLEQEPEGSERTDIDIIREELEQRAYISDESLLTKGHAKKAEKPTYGDYESLTPPVNLVTGTAKMLIPSLALLQTGEDFQVQTKDGLKSLVKVESLYGAGEVIGKNELGKLITSTGSYLDPNRPGIFWVTDSEGKTHEITKETAHTWMLKIAKATGDYQADDIDKFLEDNRAYDNQVFDPSKFTTSDPEEQREIQIEETKYLQEHVDRKTNLSETIENTGRSGWWNTFGSITDSDNVKDGKILQDEIFKDATLYIDGVGYKDVEVEVGEYTGEFKLINSDTGKDISKWMSTPDLKSMLDESEYIYNRKYLDRMKSSNSGGSGTGLVVVNTTAEYNALAPGTEYVDKNGNKGVKQ